MTNKMCVLKCHLPSKFLKWFLNSAPKRALEQVEMNQGAPLWGLMDGKRETEIQEIWELSVQSPCSGGLRPMIKGMATLTGLSTRTWGPAARGLVNRQSPGICLGIGKNGGIDGESLLKPWREEEPRNNSARPASWGLTYGFSSLPQAHISEL